MKCRIFRFAEFTIQWQTARAFNKTASNFYSERKLGMELDSGCKFICNHGNHEENQHFILPANKIEMEEIVNYRASKYDDKGTALIPLTIPGKAGDKKWPQEVKVHLESDKILHKNESGITALVVYDKLVRHKLIFLLQKTYK